MQGERLEKQGRDFYIAAKTIRKRLLLEISEDTKYNLYIPMIVNYAFSLELFLKMFLVLEGKTPKKTHDLYRLFSDLNKSLQDRIYKQVKKPEYFIEDLKATKDFFSDYRYIFETGRANIHHCRLIEELADILYVMTEEIEK